MMTSDSFILEFVFPGVLTLTPLALLLTQATNPSNYVDSDVPEPHPNAAQATSLQLSNPLIGCTSLNAPSPPH